MQAGKKGENGDVEGAQALMKQVETLQTEIREIKGLTADGRANTGNKQLDALAEKEKRMHVCEVCASFLVMNDADRMFSSSRLSSSPHGPVPCPVLC